MTRRPGPVDLGAPETMPPATPHPKPSRTDPPEPADPWVRVEVRPGLFNWVQRRPAERKEDEK